MKDWGLSNTYSSLLFAVCSCTLAPKKNRAFSGGHGNKAKHLPLHSLLCIRLNFHINLPHVSHSLFRGGWAQTEMESSLPAAMANRLYIYIYFTYRDIITMMRHILYNAYCIGALWVATEASLVFPHCDSMALGTVFKVTGRPIETSAVYPQFRENVKDINQRVRKGHNKMTSQLAMSLS